MAGRVLFALSLLIMVATLAAAPRAGANLSASEPAQEPEALLRGLQEATGGDARISYHALTSQVRFIGTTPKRAIRVAGLAELGQQPSPQAAARTFLATYGRLFGLRDQAQELSVMKERVLEDGRTFVRFQQRYGDIPVFGGELIVQLNKAGEAISANGEILPDVNLNTTPAIDAAAAQEIAITKVAKVHGVEAASLTASEPALWLYHPALLDAPGPAFTALVWRIEVTPDELAPIRELVLVDAHLGVIALNFNQIHDAKNRMTYDANDGSVLPGILVREEGDPPTGDTDVDLAHDYAGDIYDFFFVAHGRDSLDDAGMTLISTTHYCPTGFSCPYQNAFWNGVQIVYGEGFSQADDVVGHEFTHGVTDHESHLFYYYQSGAINESFSDLWGEFIDQTNGSGSDDPADKWLLGEDIPGFGAIRDMEHPPTFGDPDRIGSPNYWCDPGDLGGVHVNSGVNNKAAYLMTDGGSFNGQTVTGMGISKVADLYYEVQTNMLTSGSNYQDLYDALIQAGINLGYSVAEQQEIQDALTAVEMSLRPCGGDAEAPVCPAGQVADNIFFDDLENPDSGNWTTSANVGSIIWYYPQNTHPYTGFDATYATSGDTNFWGENIEILTDSAIAMTGNVTVPAGAYMHFNHSYGFENDFFDTYDGGVVEYSTNNGGSWNDAGSLFSHNGYNGTISNSFDNPLGGRDAFVAESYGYTASRLNLSSLAGSNVRFRFRIGTDSSIFDWGWFIDDIRIYTCVTQPPASDTIFVSSSTDGVAGSVPFADEDILVYEADGATWSMHFDGSDVAPVGIDIDAFTILADGSLLLSFTTATNLTGINAVADPWDIIRFVPTSLGDETAGSFQLYFDGSDVGLDTAEEDIDALYSLPDGRLVISSLGNFNAGGVNGVEADLFLFTPTSLGPSTSGSWSFAFDGSDIGLTAPDEDIWGVWVDPVTLELYLTTAGAFESDGLSGDGGDIFICQAASLGTTTSCASTTLYWDGAANGFGDEVIDGLFVSQPAP